jgi:hypothetical protein
MISRHLLNFDDGSGGVSMAGFKSYPKGHINMVGLRKGMFEHRNTFIGAIEIVVIAD